MNTADGVRCSSFIRFSFSAFSPHSLPPVIVEFDLHTCAYIDLNETRNTYAYQAIIGRFRLTAKRTNDNKGLALLYGLKHNKTWRCNLIIAPAHTNQTASAMDSEMRGDYPAIAAYDLVLVGAIVARESGRLQAPEDLF